MATPVLYVHPFSSYSQKVLTAFYEKAAPFQQALLSSADPSAGERLGAIWPLGKFPVIEADGRVLAEASVIIEWLDHRHPEPRLIPADPDHALDVRMLDRVFDNYVMAPMQAIVSDRLRPAEARDPMSVDQARRTLDRAHGWLDGVLADREWAGGEDFSLADCAAAPSLFYADWVHPFEDRAHLTAYFRRLLARPSFARAVEEARPYRHLFPGGAPERN